MEGTGEEKEIGRGRKRTRERKLQMNKQMDPVFLKGCLKMKKPLIDSTSLSKTAFLIY